MCISVFPIHGTRLPSPPPSFHLPNKTLPLLQIMKFHVMQFSPALFHFLAPRPRYLPQHPILEHPQLTLLRQCKRPGLTATYSSRQNCSSATIPQRGAIRNYDASWRTNSCIRRMFQYLTVCFLEFDDWRIKMTKDVKLQAVFFFFTTSALVQVCALPDWWQRLLYESYGCRPQGVQFS